MIKEIIETEDRSNPYSDIKLVDLLAANGINIARRTIAKYRDIMHIPVGPMRTIMSTD